MEKQRHDAGSIRQIKRNEPGYLLKKVRRNAPEKLAESSLLQTAFAAVPKEHIYTSGRIYEEITPADQPVLMIQTGGACLQATNQIEPYLLKTALEVMLTC